MKICPKCQQVLVYRKGVSKKIGEPYEMMSCSGYPNCNYIENAPSSVELLMKIVELLEKK